jgi:hypothetical protein
MIPVGSSPVPIAITPDQSPSAAFTADSAMIGRQSSFDASASTAFTGQTIATYHWDFGDGSTQTTSSPTTSHTYAAIGDYTATLTVTDDIGCSTAQIFTGQTMSCNGGPAAEKSHQAMVTAQPPPPPPMVTKLHLLRDTFTASHKPTPLGPPTPKQGTGTEISFSLNEAALVHFSIRHLPRRPNPSGPKVPHTFNRRLGAGKQSVRFSGTLDHHTLHPGGYELFARAVDEASGYRSPKVSAKFAVLRG